MPENDPDAAVVVDSPEKFKEVFDEEEPPNRMPRFLWNIIFSRPDKDEDK